jgi:hypothetical protein
VTIDERHADRRTTEGARRVEATESAADNHDMWDVWHLPVTGCNDEDTDTFVVSIAPMC